MVTPRAYPLTWGLGGGLFLTVGGASGDILNPSALSSGEIYNDATPNSPWTVGPSLNVPRAACAIHRTARGQVHVMGGSAAGGIITFSSEWFYF
jgi:hypothetical protein